MIIFKFHPSSHSDDGTIVVTFKNGKAAKNVAKRFTCHGGTCWGSKVKIPFSNAQYGTLENTASLMREAGAKDVLKCEGYQE
jgi:hypothetical protein